MPPFTSFRLALVLFFALASVQAYALNPRLNHLPPRARADPATTTQSSSAAATTSAAAQATTTQQQVVTLTPSSASPAQQASTTAAAAPTSAQQQVTSSAAQSSAAQSNAAPSQQPQSSTSAFVTTKGGQVVTSVIVVSDSPSTSSTANSSQSPAAANSTSGGSSSSVSSSTIIGLSVAGGVAVLGVIGFFVWKLTRKRMHDFSNNEEIKWPELNSHDASVPLPTNRTGGSGFDTAADVGRTSIGGYAASTAATSTAELYPDPYAVPPLPHLDPNQPYRDDPNAGFYDPYRGPIPPSFDQATAGEAIPMTQLAGRRSPGPGAAYGVMGSGGRASPVPQVAYGGGDFGGRASPGPRAAGFAAASGRVSPGPQAAYGNYGPR